MNIKVRRGEVKIKVKTKIYELSLVTKRTSSLTEVKIYN